jgi:hypothetical protein
MSMKAQASPAPFAPARRRQQPKIDPGHCEKAADINDRLSFMRFLGLGLGNKVPDAKTIWAFRERLTKAGATLSATQTRRRRRSRRAGSRRTGRRSSQSCVRRTATHAGSGRLKAQNPAQAGF